MKRHVNLNLTCALIGVVAVKASRSRRESYRLRQMCVPPSHRRECENDMRIQPDGSENINRRDAPGLRLFSEQIRYDRFCFDLSRSRILQRDFPKYGSN